MMSRPKASRSGSFIVMTIPSSLGAYLRSRSNLPIGGLRGETSVLQVLLIPSPDWPAAFIASACAAASSVHGQGSARRGGDATPASDLTTSRVTTYCFLGALIGAFAAVGRPPRERPRGASRSARLAVFSGPDALHWVQFFGCFTARAGIHSGSAPIICLRAASTRECARRRRSPRWRAQRFFPVRWCTTFVRSRRQRRHAAGIADHGGVRAGNFSRDAGDGRYRPVAAPTLARSVRRRSR